MGLKGILLITLCVLAVAAGVGESHAVPFFSDSPKRAVFLSPLEEWMPTWNLDAYVQPLQRAGYQVDVLFNENVSIAFLGTELAKYDVIILRTDSFGYEGFDFYCSGEPVANARTRFAGEISSRELHVGACVGFSVLFLSHSYPTGSLRPGFVYAIGSTTAALSSTFLKAGAVAFIGYYEDKSLQWGRVDALSQKLLSYLSQGYSINDSIIRLTRYLNTGHGSTATWPMLYLSGDGTYKL